MHNLDEIIKIYYNYVSVQEIFAGKIKAYQFPKEEYTPLAAAYLECYSDTEQSNLYEYIQSSRNITGHNYARKKGRSGLNVFAALEELAEELFILEENEVKCHYEHMLRLRNVEKCVDLDLMVAAFLVANSLEIGSDTTLRQGYLMRDVTVSHNNLQLKRILEQGLAENHFHLYGSSPMFHLMWVQMMNEITENQEELFREIDACPRTVRVHYRNRYTEDGCKEKILKAALLRLVLVEMLIREKESMKLTSEEPEKPKEEELQAFADELVHNILLNKEDVKDYYGIILKKIRVLKGICELECGCTVEDYAMLNIEMTDREKQELTVLSGIKNDRFAVFAGERWLIYELLKKEYSQKYTGEDNKIINHEWIQWFYAYLVIKNQIRNEILQTNNKIGFENFSIFNHRKNTYPSRQIMAKLAVCGALEEENIEKFEVRISPKDTHEKCAALIEELESVERRDEDKLKHVFYVFHFPKSKEKNFESCSLIQKQKCCRHNSLRKDLEKQARAIEEFRNYYPRYASRVLGIDSCAQEIGCRPEVFGPVFRRLAKHTSTAASDKYVVPQLRLTYHVGEDFLDVVDGLRAVDEAVHFLNLRCGSRIGHGTVLGIPVEKWYQRKRNTIVLSRQDYLDNIVWLYHKINEFKIEDCSQLLEFLSQEFEENFYLVYRKNIDMKDVKNIWQESAKEYGGNEREIKDYAYSFDIFTYYAAWKLRGDDPSLYQRGYYRENPLFSKEQGEMVNMNYPARFEMRKQRDVSILYYYYHFNSYVYMDGKEKIEKLVPDCYIEGVKKVQKAMQSFIGKRGIGIECNPSSNLMISTMESYAEHPIVQLYNKDLEKDVSKMQECLQLFVSINTDDKGVFHTSLENEYALMACAMEKIRDKQGNPVYNRQMIYQWLDNIRKMGLQQSFMGRSKEENG